MHVRFSTIVGTPVVEQGSDMAIAGITDILIHPDTGKIEGFFVEPVGFFQSEALFLSSLDIIRWGTAVVIRDRDILCPLEDFIRLQDLLNDERRILDQRMKTESGRSLGVCRDLQFDTNSMKSEWLFPKKFFRWGTALPMREVVEVRTDAIIVRDPPAAQKYAEPQEEEPTILQVIESIPEVQEPKATRSSQ